MAMDNNISVIIIDDHPLVLNGLAHILGHVEHLSLTATFISAREGIDYLRENKIDVVLLDINLPDMDGISACTEIKRIHPAIKIIAISNNNEASIINRMMQSGANGYLLKNASAKELVEAITQVEYGAVVLPDSVKEILKKSEKQEIPFVTRREKEVLTLMAKGHTTPEIAEKLFLSPLTIESHRRNLLQKFKVNNAASLIHKATEMKFIAAISLDD